MVAVKVWLGGEGTCELGGRADGNDRLGAIEALLIRIEATGWNVFGATTWKSLRKYQVGAALNDGMRHADVENVRKLVFHASEQGCEVVAFTRDRDADDEREAAVVRGIELSSHWRIGIIGGLAKPCLEGWILALLGHRDTDGLSRRRADERLKSQGVEGKSPEIYVQIVETAYPDDIVRSLPVGCESLKSWLETASHVLGRAIRGL